MNTCSICGTHTKVLDLGIPHINTTRRPGEKLEFVEHVLGVLIESRYGNGHPYRRLGEQFVTTGHSQMFANVSLLSAAEIDAHLNSVHRHSPDALLCGFLCEFCELCVSERTLHEKRAKYLERTKKSWDVRCMSPPLRSYADAGSYSSRGSPKFLGPAIFQPL